MIGQFGIVCLGVLFEEKGLDRPAGHGFDGGAADGPAVQQRADVLFDRRAPYDFFSVYHVPDVVTQRQFEAGIAASGWYDYFERVNIIGAALSPVGALLNNVALLPPTPQGPPIPPVSPITKQRVNVLGRTMTYADEGAGVPVVFVHGDVMSSFLWRNVIPHLDGQRTRSLAGDSDKLPDAGPGTYAFATHARYFDVWMEALDLRDGVVLVGHDGGANVTFDWAMRHEDQVRGLAFSEAITPPFDWEDWPAQMRPQFQYLRTAEGERDVLENNFFVPRRPAEHHPYAHPGRVHRNRAPLRATGRGPPPHHRLAPRGAVRQRPQPDAHRSRGTGRMARRHVDPQAAPPRRPGRHRPTGRPQAEVDQYVAEPHRSTGPRAALDTRGRSARHGLRAGRVAAHPHQLRHRPPAGRRLSSPGGASAPRTAARPKVAALIPIPARSRPITAPAPTLDPASATATNCTSSPRRCMTSV
ncbi:hypothetical protein GCM10018775_88420 [Streptomyces umbrinus]|nr:hypothetical protein GCM10018775_88420 [Streptomyces umbrinus]